MAHKVFPKIKALYDSDTEGILDGEILIQEKIDGANLSIWMDEKGISIGSKNNIIYDNGEYVINTCKKTGKESKVLFNGAVEYVRNHEGINKLLEDHPEYRLYGEWLVPHTIQYSPEAYKHFYLFDIYNEDYWICADVVQSYAKDYNIICPQALYQGFADKDLAESFVGLTNLGDEGEGVVIKRLDDWTNKWGNHQYAKIVSEKFKESNAITFGGNNKHADAYIEQYIVNKYCTEGRMLKLINKILISSEKEALDKSDTPRVLSMMEHDLLTEEIWNIYKKFAKRSVNFGDFKRICGKKTRIMFHLFVEGKTSVAFNENKDESI